MTEPAHTHRRKTAKGTAHREAGAAKPRSHHRKRVSSEEGDGDHSEDSGVAGTAQEPLEGEVVRTGIPPQASRAFGRAARWIEGMLPTADGGPAPVVTAARVRFAGWIWALIGLLAGCLAGALAVLLVTGMPSIPMGLAGLSAGAILGATTALVFSSRFPVMRKAGGVAILLAPLLLLAAPFLLLAGGIALLLRFPKRGSGGGKAR